MIPGIGLLVMAGVLGRQAVKDKDGVNLLLSVVAALIIVLCIWKNAF